MRDRLRRFVPKPLLRLQRRVRNEVGERRALAQLPKAECDASRLRSSLDLDDVFTAADPDAWARVAAKIAAGGLTHNPAGVNPGDRRALSALVAYLEPRRVLEVGTHIGSSTVALAATLAGTGAEITTVDITDVNDPKTRPWVRYGARQSPAELVAGEAPVTFVTRSSLDFLAETKERFDFIFLDGDHRADAVYRELPLALSRLAPDGVILLHDYFPGGQRLWAEGELVKGPYRAVDRLKREGAGIRDVPLGELPWPTKLGGNVTSLAVILSRPQ